MKITTKRFLSYIMDMILVFLVVSIIRGILPQNKYAIELSNLQQDYFEKKIDKDAYYEQYIQNVHISDKQDIVINVCTTLVMIVAFIVVPFATCGQTIGQKIMRVKVTGKIRIDELVGRSIINNGLGYMLLLLSLVYITSDNVYFAFMNIFAFFQILVVIISGFMILYKENHVGIADILTKTRIEEIA